MIVVGSAGTRFGGVAPTGKYVYVGFRVASLGFAISGYWEVEYDLAPGSTLQISSIMGTDIDPITGTLTVRYDAATQSAPLTSVKLLQGHTNVQASWSIPAVFLITGTTDMNLIPQVGGTPGTLNGATLTLGVVADSSTTGFLHCNESGGQTGNCVLAGMIHTLPMPQTPTGPGPFPQTFPKFVFTSGTAGVGSFTSTVLTQTVRTGVFTVTLYATYVGRSVSRVWTEPVPSISSGGFAVLGVAVFGIALAGLAVQRRRRAG